MEIGNGRGTGLHFPARVEVVEYLGDDRLVHMVRHETPLLAMIPTSQLVDPGQEVEVAVAPEKLHVFEAETDQRVAT